MKIQSDSFGVHILMQACLLIAIAGILGSVANLFLGIDHANTALTAGIAIISLTNLWLLKKFKAYKLVRSLMSFIVLLILNAAWYFNYNSHGSILSLFILLAILIIFIWPQKKALMMGAMILLNIGLLYFINLNFNETLIQYNSEFVRISDVYFGIFVSVSVALFFSYTAKKHYLRKYEEAKKSNELKTAFLQNMSHELRTPLNAIIGFSDVLDEYSSVEEMLRFNKIIHSGGNHLLSLVNDLLDINLIESGEVKPVMGNFNLRIAMEEVQDLLRFEKINLKKDKVELVLEEPTIYPNIIICTDEAKLKQVLINLLKNALKFTESGIINFGYTIELKKHQVVIKFYVTDTGIGIEKKNEKSIFNTFWQVDHSHSKSHGGAGIGLALSKKLVHLLDGDIWVESKIGEGSSFYFVIPINEFVLEKAEMNTTNSDSLHKLNTDYRTKKKTVLITEDADASYEYLKVVLEKMGIATLWAKNGEEAIKISTENKFINLILMDINMPIVDGYEATRTIKKIRPKLPIIAQTAYAITGDREKALEAGCDDYIPKPIKKDALQLMINKYLA